MSIPDRSHSYIGRFAPSPTGPLHLGSLYAALASFLDARANKGQWILRIDDLDTFRNVAGAADNIVQTLKVFGLIWDGEVQFQSDSLKNYHQCIDFLLNQNLVYPCQCTRKALAKLDSAVYPGFCLNANVSLEAPHALRIKSSPICIHFNDQIQGKQTSNISNDYGDFIIRRKDKIIAYQLAVVIDDYQQNINHVVRGFDLLDSTPRQIYLQQLLGYPTPNYSHIPVIVDQQGDKLSKQTFATAVSTDNPEQTLLLLLKLLNQAPPDYLSHSSVSHIINWAITHWQPAQLKKIRAINNNI